MPIQYVTDKDIENGKLTHYANRGFKALAKEAGLDEVIKSLIPLAVSELDLLAAIKNALESTNPELAEALNLAILKNYIEDMGDNAPVVPDNQLPELIDPSVQSGPVSVSAARDGGDSSLVNVTTNESPSGYTGSVYLDGIPQDVSFGTPSGGFMSTQISSVSPGDHTIRVLYNRDADGAITEFGPIANIS